MNIFRKTVVRAETLLRKAADLISGDRASAHGDKRENHENIAAYWSAYLTIEFDTQLELTGHQVAMMMSLFKIARTHAGAHNLDDYVDGAGYMAIAGQLADEDCHNVTVEEPAQISGSGSKQ